MDHFKCQQLACVSRPSSGTNAGDCCWQQKALTVGLHERMHPLLLDDKATDGGLGGQALCVWIDCHVARSPGLSQAARLCAVILCLCDGADHMVLQTPSAQSGLQH